MSDAAFGFSRHFLAHVRTSDWGAGQDDSDEACIMGDATVGLTRGSQLDVNTDFSGYLYVEIGYIVLKPGTRPAI